MDDIQDLIIALDLSCGREMSEDTLDILECSDRSGSEGAFRNIIGRRVSFNGRRFQSLIPKWRRKKGRSITRSSRSDRRRRQKSWPGFRSM